VSWIHRSDHQSTISCFLDSRCFLFNIFSFSFFFCGEALHLDASETGFAVRCSFAFWMSRCRWKRWFLKATITSCNPPSARGLVGPPVLQPKRGNCRTVTAVYLLADNRRNCRRADLYLPTCPVHKGIAVLVLWPKWGQV